MVEGNRRRFDQYGKCGGVRKCAQGLRKYKCAPLAFGLPDLGRVERSLYYEPWLGSLRESIHGTYPAGTFAPAIFPDTGLRTTFDTHVLTYYDEELLIRFIRYGQRCDETRCKNRKLGFDEGAVIIKVALFVSDDPKTRQIGGPPLKALPDGRFWSRLPEETLAPPIPLDSFVMQFDIIVKDLVSAPKTGWVFSTLVYDSNARGDGWDKMVPLGAMWGNDPGISQLNTPAGGFGKR